MKRYHRGLVGLHWVLAGLIIGMLLLGNFLTAATPNSEPAKLDYLRQHMIVGTVIFVLMTLRIIVRWKTKKPPEADIGHALLNKLGGWAHYILYILVFAMTASGWATAITAGLPGIIFFDSGAELPANFDDISSRMAHGIVSTTLILVISAHVLAALYHQFVRKDQLFARMWYGKRN